MNALRNVGLAILAAGSVVACGGGGGISVPGNLGSSSSSSSSSSSGGGSSSSSDGSIASSAGNVQPISVNLGPAGNYGNGIFTSVTICAPGTTTCQTISGILVDSGSEGLRILASALTNSSLAGALQAQTSNGSEIGECVVYGDNTYTWGPVTRADIQISGETASSVPINIFGTSGTFSGNFAGFPSPPSACSTGFTENDTLDTFGANGVLGIGTAVQDCGAECANVVDNYDYFACGGTSGPSCAPSTESLPNQVQNPVPLFATDNNGVIIELPSIPSTGQASVSGSLVFGIGTESNNALGSAQVLTVTDNGDIGSGSFSTKNSNGSIPGFTGSAVTAIIDSGSNGLFFPSSITICKDQSSFYCPSATESYSAQMIGTNGASVTIPFSVANADTLFDNNGGNNAAFNNIAGPASQFFDWGLPFFFGRNVYFAINGDVVSGVTGPYNAFIAN